MKPHSPRDIAFMEAFAKKLSKRRDDAKKKEGVSYEQFARKLGLTRAGVRNYLKEKNVPSPAMLEKVAAVWGVKVGYGDLDVELIKKRGRRNSFSSEAQMLLPLALESLTDRNIQVELAEKKANAIELNVTITFVPKRA